MLYFEKLHGAGNDFIIFNWLKEKLPNLSMLAKSVCDRHFGIGADGMMIVDSSEIADIKMIFFNADGSEAPMCGNGIRCFSKYVFDNKVIEKEVFDVETLAGIIKVELIQSSKGIDAVKINLGMPVYDIKALPVNITGKKTVINEEIKFNNQIYRFTTLMMGTIHTVIFVDSLDKIDVCTFGSYIENHPMFPQKTNVNFCEIIDSENLKVVTWERGVGKTLACGTGAAATTVTSNRVNNTSSKANVHVTGGILKIEETKDGVYMTGPAERICKGEYNYLEFGSNENETF